MIFSTTHAFEVFRTPNIKLKDTPIIKRVEPQPIFLVESIDTQLKRPAFLWIQFPPVHLTRMS